MMTSDGWKYLLVVSKNLGQSRVKVIIPSHLISERLATISFNDSMNETKSKSRLKVNALIIDDSLTTCKSICRILDKSGQNADYESNSMSVLNMNLNEYNIILCDIHMPNLNGLDLCRSVRGIFFIRILYQ
jgi:PleD family two-component response regulator